MSEPATTGSPPPDRPGHNVDPITEAIRKLKAEAKRYPEPPGARRPARRARQRDTQATRQARQTPRQDRSADARPVRLARRADRHGVRGSVHRGRHDGGAALAGVSPHHGRERGGVDADGGARDGDRHRELVFQFAQQPLPGQLAAPVGQRATMRQHPRLAARRFQQRAGGGWPTGWAARLRRR
jgi:hypothetical protein